MPFVYNLELISYIDIGNDPRELADHLCEHLSAAISTGKIAFTGRITAVRADSMDSIDRASTTAGTSETECFLAVLKDPEQIS